MHLGSLTEESIGLSAGGLSAVVSLCSSCSSLLLSSCLTGSASAHLGGFREGRVANCTSLLSLVLSGASGIRFVLGHLIPEGEKKVNQKCTEIVSDTSDREQDPDGTIQ